MRYKMDEPGKRTTILVVEDDPDLRLVHSEILSHEGYSVLTAADGLEALEVVESQGPPTMILLDLRMPRMNGWDLVERLRQRPAWRDIPIVVVAAHYRIADEAAAIGARAWLHKPVSIDALVRVVGEVSAESAIGGRS
jgi:CheY-like chemotaxis protein